MFLSRVFRPVHKRFQPTIYCSSAIKQNAQLCSSLHCQNGARIKISPTSQVEQCHLVRTGNYSQHFVPPPTTTRTRDYSQHSAPPPSTTTTRTRDYSQHSAPPPSTTIASELTEAEYDTVADEMLDRLNDQFEDLAEQEFSSQDFDVNFASGVLTVKLGDGKGTYVINKQTPNRQIWLSSPVSGPKRYDYISKQWIYKHEQKTIHTLLSEELSELYQTNIVFTSGDPDT